MQEANELCQPALHVDLIGLIACSTHQRSCKTTRIDTCIRGVNFSPTAGEATLVTGRFAQKYISHQLDSWVAEFHPGARVNCWDESYFKVLI